MNKARIYVFGDSQTYGAWDSQGGWCDRIKRTMHQHTLDDSAGVRFQMFNLGIGGEHSRALLKRIKTELDFRNRPDWPPVIIIATGENDTRYPADGEPVVPLHEYRSNLKDIIAVAKAYTDRLLLVGICTVRDEVTDFKGTFINQADAARYDDAMAEIAQAESVRRVDVRSAMAEHAAEGLFCKDGVHMNDKGHELVAGLVAPALQILLDQE